MMMENFHDMFFGPLVKIIAFCFTYLWYLT